MEITKGELKLISRLLEMAGNEFSNHGCNDMDQALWDEIGFTPEDRATMIHEMQLWNGDTKDPYPTKLIHVRDDMVMNFYAHKLVNANLAGMEPRCPKCGSEVTWWITSKDCMPVVRCRAEKCDEIFRIKELSDFAQFFRSPAPTTPLDRKMLEAVAEDGLLVTWDKDHKFSFSQVVRLMAEFAIECEPAASPAQPEKRDEWVSVDERLPTEEECKANNGWFQVCNSTTKRQDVAKLLKGREFMGHALQFNDITHWQPLPAPPQSGKEGQA